MIIRMILALSLTVFALPARADTTAVYTVGHDDLAMTMTIEIADTGEVRVQMGGPMLEKMPKGVAIYGISRDGDDFTINETPEGTSVIRMSDAMTVMAEHWAKAKQEFGIGDAHIPDVELVSRGEQTVNGRAGTAFYKRNDGKTEEPMLVVSQDPALAQLGREMARRFAKSAGGMQAMGIPVLGDSMLKALNGGAPLAFAGLAKLQSVRHDPVPVARFVLPAQPKTLDETRALMNRKPPVP